MNAEEHEEVHKKEHDAVVPTPTPSGGAPEAGASSSSKRRQRAKKLAAVNAEGQEKEHSVLAPTSTPSGGATDAGASSSSAARKRPRAIFEYGNYEAYYGYRYATLRSGGRDLDRAASEATDPRLTALDRPWFRGAACLDIGCNAGSLTLAIARRLGVRSMLGVDIDHSLVAKAIEQQKQHEEQEGAPTPGDDHAARAGKEARGHAAAASSGGAPAAPTGPLSNDDFRRLFLPPAAAAAPPPPPARFPQNTSFEQCNFVAEPPCSSQLGTRRGVGGFDVVTCFSTTKWVHLNFGDAGLRRLFARAHACLRPGGRLVLEPQPWKSYRKRMHLTPTIAHHFQHIALKPAAFEAYLLSKDGGFAACEHVDVPYGDATAQGFKRRPLLVFTK